MAEISVLSAELPAAILQPSFLSHQCQSFHEAVEVSRNERHSGMPFDLDLGDPRSIATLRAIDVVWQQISPAERSHWLRGLRVTLPVRPDALGDVALLPGGVVAVRHRDGVLVCDPLEPTTLSDAEAWQLRRTISSRAGIATLLHVEAGVVMTPCIPELLPPQSATIVSDATRLPCRAATAGPALIQWFTAGATVWPLVPAPQSIALAATVA